MAPKPIVFRVRGIPAGLSGDAVLSSLKAALIACGDATEEQLRGISKADVVPSCGAEDYACALLNWQGESSGFLSRLSKDSQHTHQVEVGWDSWTVDRHFFGFTQLYTPVADRAVTADIIAITGLDGHAYGSFASRGKPSRMWLRDFLSKDLPHCRTMVYGYDSKLSSRGIDTIMDYGRAFLEELKKTRRTPEVRKRPLFFIAHGFGGIVLAHCLIKAVLEYGPSDEASSSLYKATYGILFFGISHKGTMVQDIRKISSDEEDHPSDPLHDQIKANSNALILELSRFKNITGDRKIISFFEQKQTRGLEREQESQTWTRKGSFSTAVEVDSAVLQLPDSMEVKVALNSDHSNMIKFDSRQDVGYTSALQYLKEFERDAPGVVAARFGRLHVAPTPKSTIPFRRDDSFVGQEQTLLALQDILTRPNRHNRAALYGLGGVGKSQIAIEFSYRFREKYTNSWVFWVCASSAARFEQSFWEIASHVELPGHDDPKCDIFRLVFQWLLDKHKSQWMIILDNADDRETIFAGGGGDITSTEEQGVSQAQLASFLPQTENGCVLVTSRNKLLASDLVLGDNSIFHIQTMDESTAMLLFRTRVEVPSAEEGECMQLLHELDYLPLAIVHASTYIKARAPRMTIATYLQLLVERGDTKSLLEDPLNDPRRDRGSHVSILTIWEISFDEVQRQSPLSAELFSRMTVLDRQAIPAFLFHRKIKDIAFDDALALLLDFSLLTVDSKRKSFSIHRLVQLARRKWLEVRGELYKSQEWSLERIASVFPKGTYENREKCRILLPHAETVLKYVSANKRDSLLHGCTIRYNCAWYFLTLGKYNVAETMSLQALEGREQELGPLHPDTLASVSNLALVLQYQGKYGASEAMNRRALEGKEQELGPFHPDTLTSITNLASVLLSQGRYEASEAMNRRALEGCEQDLGPLHPDTLTSVSNLALVLQYQGKYEASEAMNRRALEGREQDLGPLHPDTLTSVSNLALVLQYQGKYEASEAMNRRALEGREQDLGPLHPDTLTSVSNLALVLKDQGKYVESEAMSRRALEGREQDLGPLHPDTWTSVSNLALVLWYQGKYEESEAMNRRILAEREQDLGPMHPDTLTSVSNLALVLRDQGKYEASEAMTRRALEGKELQLGPLHPSTLTSISNLASVLQDQGRHEVSEALYQRALAGYEQELGLPHPNTLLCIDNLAVVLRLQGKYEASETMTRRALEVKKLHLGPLHPSTLTSISNLASILQDQGMQEASEAIHRRAREGVQAITGSDYEQARSYMKSPIRPFGPGATISSSSLEAFPNHSEPISELPKGEASFDEADPPEKGKLAVVDKDSQYRDQVPLSAVVDEPAASLKSLVNVGGELGKSRKPQGLHFSDSGYKSDTHRASSNVAVSNVDGQGRRTNPDIVKTLSSSEDGEIRVKYQETLDRGDDIRSVISDATDIGSLASHRREGWEVDAEKHFAAELSKNDELKPLFDEALARIEESRLINNFRRLLKQYYLGLRQSAKTPFERRTTHLLKSRWSRERIAKFAIDPPEPADEDSFRGAPASRPILDLEQWISSHAAFAPYPEHLTPQPSVSRRPESRIAEHEHISDSGSENGSESGTENESDSNDNADQPNLGEIKRFLLSGPAFKNLITGVRLFLLHPSYVRLTNTLMPISRDSVWLSYEDDESISNKIKAFAENLTETEWDWWPLRSRVRKLGTDQVRLNWICHCNTHLWKEVPRIQGEKIRTILQKSEKTPSLNHFCEARTSLGTSVFSLIKAAFGSRSPSTSTSKSPPGQPSMPLSVWTPQGRRQLAATPVVPLSTNSNDHEISRTPATDSAYVTIKIPESARERFVLLGVPSSRHTPELAHINSEDHDTDDTFYSELFREYRSNRGFFRYHFSIWQFKQCNFVKFERISKNRVLLRGQELPEALNPAYDFNPKPPIAKLPPTEPPIDPHEFKMAFLTCPKHCWMSLLHDCVQWPSTRQALEKIPKKKGRFHLGVNTREEAWGLQAYHEICAFRVWLYHVAIVCGPIGFWVWYNRHHPGDIQDASVPLTLILALLSLFWSSSGLLKGASSALQNS